MLQMWRVYQRGLERWIADLLQPVFDSLVSDGMVPRFVQVRMRVYACQPHIFGTQLGQAYTPGRAMHTDESLGLLKCDDQGCMYMLRTLHNSGRHDSGTRQGVLQMLQSRVSATAAGNSDRTLGRAGRPSR